VDVRARVTLSGSVSVVGLLQPPQVPTARRRAPSLNLTIALPQGGKDDRIRLSTLGEMRNARNGLRRAVRPVNRRTILLEELPSRI